MTTDLERRLTKGSVEMRAASDGASKIGGYAAKFMRYSQNLGGFVEQVMPTFFDKSAADGWAGAMCRYNHTLLLGTTAAASLRLAITSDGLDYEADLLDDVDSVRVAKLVGRGDVAHSSFAFYTYEDDWSLTTEGFPLRSLISGKLVDVAPVDQPAYLDTSTGVRDLASAGLRSLAEARDLEIDEVRDLADRNELSRLFKPAPTVIPVDDSPTPRSDEQGETHSAIGVQARLRALELNKQH